MKNALFAAAFAISAPFAANAAPIDIFAATPYTFVSTLTPGGSVTWDFNVMDSFQITQFAFAATGNNGGADLANVTFSIDGGAAQSLAVFASGNSATGFAFAAGSATPYLVGDQISFVVTDGVKDNVGLTLSFTTGPALAPVPLPAAGLLLGSLLVAGGTAAARKKKKSA